MEFVSVVAIVGLVAVVAIVSRQRFKGTVSKDGVALESRPGE
jgi:hypothetical protein